MFAARRLYMYMWISRGRDMARLILIFISPIQLISHTTSSLECLQYSFMSLPLDIQFLDLSMESLPLDIQDLDIQSQCLSLWTFKIFIFISFDLQSLDIQPPCRILLISARETEHRVQTFVHVKAQSETDAQSPHWLCICLALLQNLYIDLTRDSISPSSVSMSLPLNIWTFTFRYSTSR